MTIFFPVEDNLFHLQKRAPDSHYLHHSMVSRNVHVWILSYCSGDGNYLHNLLGHFCLHILSTFDILLMQAVLFFVVTVVSGLEYT